MVDEALGHYRASSSKRYAFPLAVSCACAVGSITGAGYGIEAVIAVLALGVIVTAIFHPVLMTLLFAGSVAFDKVALTSIGDLPITASKVFGFLVILAWIIWAGSRDRVRCVRSRATRRLYGILALWYLVTTLSAATTEASHILNHLSTASLVFVVPALAAFVSNERTLGRLLSIFMLVMTASSFLLIVQAVVGHDPLGLVEVKRAWSPIIGTYPRPGGTFDDPNYFSLYASTLALPVTLSYVISGRKRRWALLCTVLIVTAMLISFSIGGMLGLVVLGIHSFLYVRRRQRVPRTSVRSYRILSLMIVLVLSAGTLALAMPKTPMGAVLIERVSSKLSGGRGEPRLEIWAVNIRMILDNPIVGVGSSNVLSEFDGYRVDESVNANWSHNAFLGVAVARGLPAALLFLGLLCFVGRMLWRTRHLTRGHSLLNSFHFSLSGMYLAYLVQSVFLNTQNDKILWILCGLTLALTNMCYRHHRIAGGLQCQT